MHLPSHTEETGRIHSEMELLEMKHIYTASITYHPKAK